ncbi:hypothetical protein VA599_06330 [Chromobacterium sp. TRC.1.1.SA]|uniref:Uncharacterized protein n=1 Tax=Chromobacterium indicum TaxID=3110228 RepID=A0ABV0CIY2_9NEIS
MIAIKKIRLVAHIPHVIFQQQIIRLPRQVYSGLKSAVCAAGETDPGAPSQTLDCFSTEYEPSI